MGGVGKGPKFRDANARRHRIRMGDEIPYSPPKNVGGNHGEAEMVPREPLAAVLSKWQDEWVATHPSPQNNGRENDSGFSAGPHEVLSEWTEQLGNKVGVRTIWRILTGAENTMRVSLSTADALLAAIDMQHLLGNEIPVVTHPAWSQEQYMEYMAERGCI